MFSAAAERVIEEAFREALSRRHAYLTDSPVPPSIVVKQCGGLAAFPFCVRVYRSFLSIRRAIRASLVWRLGDSRGQ